MRHGNDGLLYIEAEAHNKLQVLIAQWMAEHVEEAMRLKDICGPGIVAQVSCRAATAAADSVAHSLEILGLA